jgi:hypothetical protein
MPIQLLCIRQVSIPDVEFEDEDVIDFEPVPNIDIDSNTTKKYRNHEHSSKHSECYVDINRSYNNQTNSKVTVAR